MSLCCITSFHLLSIPNISQNIPHWSFCTRLSLLRPPRARRRDIGCWIGQGLARMKREGGEGEGAEGWQIRTSFFVGQGVEWRTDGRVKFAWTLVCVSNFTHAHIQQPREQFGQSAEGGPKGGGRWLIINGVDLGINQGRESRRASSRANEKKKKKREGSEGGWRGREESVHRQRPN